MQGMIVLWYGEVDQLPFSWHICDGTCGTPDLRNKWVRGAGNTFAVGAMGGFKNHLHTLTGNFHFHDQATSPGPVAGGADYSKAGNNVAITGQTSNDSLRPPYYALTYIQKM